jgi:polar amino acid transport system substrate-binding protein
MSKFFLTVCFTVITAASAYCDHIIRLATGEWDPYVSENLIEYGIAAKITSEAFKAAGHKVEFIFVPWGRALDYVKHGNADASFLWVYSEERAKDALFSDVFISSTGVFFFNKKNNFDWKTLKDLENMEIGGLISGYYNWYEEAKKQGLKLKMQLVADERQNFKKLIAGHIQLFSTDYMVGTNTLQKYFSQKDRDLIAVHPKPIESWDYSVIFSRAIENPEKLVREFNEGLKIIKSNGNYEKCFDDFKKGLYNKQR